MNNRNTSTRYRDIPTLSRLFKRNEKAITQCIQRAGTQSYHRGDDKTKLYKVSDIAQAIVSGRSQS